jgi:hypothetical protein
MSTVMRVGAAPYVLILKEEDVFHAPGANAFSIDASEARIRPGDPYPSGIDVIPMVGNGGRFVFQGFDAQDTAHYKQSGLGKVAVLKIWND